MALSFYFAFKCRMLKSLCKSLVISSEFAYSNHHGVERTTVLTAASDCVPPWALAAIASLNSVLCSRQSRSRNKAGNRRASGSFTNAIALFNSPSSVLLFPSGVDSAYNEAKKIALLARAGNLLSRLAKNESFVATIIATDSLS